MKYFSILLIILLLVTCSYAAGQTTLASTTIAPLGIPIGIQVFSPWNKGHTFYQMALSWNYVPGHKIQGIHVPLNKDPLFYWSIQIANTRTFERAYGFLDDMGAAYAILRVPTIPQLRGLKFSVAVGIFRGRLLADVSNPWEITIV